ncbi:Sec-independent protein translocase subunit TatA [Pseudonocardia nematodicida]|uniref:Sec-independent protein translocase protein TatA n=1 Tax=Pseudonocardia nematodicida TaxID=1206997 RepID=A0ABV1KBP2_9PSEU
MGEFALSHWVIVLIVLILLFGASRLPDVARSVGRSARILRSELRAHDNDHQDPPDRSGDDPDQRRGP